MWFLLKDQNFIVSSNGLKEKIVKMKGGYKVNTFPFVIDEKFSKVISPDEITPLKNKYKYDQAKKLLLIVGGGDGIPKGEKILEAVLLSKPDYEIGIVCGKNEVLQKGAERLKEKYQADQLKIYGYVDFIYDLISISDVVLTKCGASTIMEILNLKKVPVVNDYIWEQEQGNVDYLVEKKLGIYEPKINMLPGVIKNLLTDGKLYSFYRNNIEREKIENGLPMVARHIMNEVTQ
jgi:processive 1,2-diacylglycerol beta-glucosyltransferase/1,2-diacylglycerol 3-beta-galactosyltransferase